VTHLTFGHQFDKKINKLKLPKTLKQINLGKKFKTKATNTKYIQALKVAWPNLVIVI